MNKVTRETPLSELVRSRRATDNFSPEPVSDSDLQEILRAGLEAPSSYNLQPWRFVVVRDLQQRRKLRAAAMDPGRTRMGSCTPRFLMSFAKESISWRGLVLES